MSYLVRCLQVDCVSKVSISFQFNKYPRLPKSCINIITLQLAHFLIKVQKWKPTTQDVPKDTLQIVFNQSVTCFGPAGSLSMSFKQHNEDITKSSCTQ